MSKRDFLRIMDLSATELEALLVRAQELKRLRSLGAETALLPGKTLILIFEKSSTRTRVSFEVGIQQMGGRAIVLNAHDCQLGRGEPIRDAARVLSRYGDLMMLRTHAHAKVEELARFATVPVINGLSDSHHPCQILADLLTLIEHKGRLRELKIAWFGDGNNVAHSWIEAAGLLGLDLTLAVPAGFEPDTEMVATARSRGGRIQIVRDPEVAALGADVLMTDVWTSMGQEDEAVTRTNVFRPYQLNAALVAQAKPDAVVLHCLPAHRGEEITDEVIEGPQSVVWDEAENRLHVQKALMEFLLQKVAG